MSTSPPPVRTFTSLHPLPRTAENPPSPSDERTNNNNSYMASFIQNTLSTPPSHMFHREEQQQDDTAGGMSAERFADALKQSASIRSSLGMVPLKVAKRSASTTMSPDAVVAGFTASANAEGGKDAVTKMLAPMMSAWPSGVSPGRKQTRIWGVDEAAILGTAADGAGGSRIVGVSPKAASPSPERSQSRSWTAEPIVRAAMRKAVEKEEEKAHHHHQPGAAATAVSVSPSPPAAVSDGDNDDDDDKKKQPQSEREAVKNDTSSKPQQQPSEVTTPRRKPTSDATPSPSPKQTGGSSSDQKPPPAAAATSAAGTDSQELFDRINKMVPSQQRASLLATSPSPAPKESPRAATTTTTTTPSSPPVKPPSSTASTTTGNNSNNSNSPFIDVVLQQHNAYRAKHGAAALDWCTDCEAAALRAAQACVKTGEFEHSNFSGSKGRHGQNLYMHSPALSQEKAVAAGVRAWYYELKKPGFNFATPDVSQPGAGHATQVLWKGTTSCGAALVTSSNGTQYLVVNYFPAGNVRGHFARNLQAEGESTTTTTSTTTAAASAKHKAASTSVPNNLRYRLHFLYQKVAPEKIGNIELILTKCPSNEERLDVIEKLIVQYGSDDGDGGGADSRQSKALLRELLLGDFEAAKRKW